MKRSSRSGGSRDSRRQQLLRHETPKQLLCCGFESCVSGQQGQPQCQHLRMDVSSFTCTA